MTSTLTKTSLEMLTGLPKEKFKPLKTKDNVDLAGLSQLLPQLNPLLESKPEPLEISLNKNLFLAVPSPISPVLA